MKTKVILLVEDNPSDIELTQRAFAKSHIANELVVAEDGQEALDYLFGADAHTGRNVRDLPTLVLLDLKLPRVEGMEVLRRIRANPRTSRAGGDSDHIQRRTGRGAKLRSGGQQLHS